VLTCGPIVANLHSAVKGRQDETPTTSHDAQRPLALGSGTFHASNRATPPALRNRNEAVPPRCQRMGRAASGDTAGDERLSRAPEGALKTKAGNRQLQGCTAEAWDSTHAAGEPERLPRQSLSTYRPCRPYHPCHPYHHRPAASEVPSLLRGCPSPKPRSLASARRCWLRSAAHSARLWRDR
jgi:hypothetical protein